MNGEVSAVLSGGIGGDYLFLIRFFEICKVEDE